MGDTSFPVMMSMEEVFNNFKCRRDGVIKALTSEFSSLFFECNPTAKNLCLYGHPNGTWEVNLPSEEVPPVIPEPAVGINFARDEMEIKDWLRLVAVHTDAWLISVAFYFGARYGFDKNERQRLFEMINELPTVFEVFEETQQQVPSTSRSGEMHQGSGSHAEIEEERNKQGSTLCGACGDPYKLDEFWILCNYCKTWYHGKCVKVTPTMAERIGQYMCHRCAALQLHRFR